MGTDTPVEGGEKKPVMKQEGNDGFHQNKSKFKKFAKRERFMGAHPDLQGFVFETGTSHNNQIANFNTVDTRIRAIVGQSFEPQVLESIEKMTLVMPPEPTIIAEPDGSMSRVEDIKYGKKYDKWLTRTEKVEKELKQVYSIYYGQCDEDIKSSLAEDATFKRQGGAVDPSRIRSGVQWNQVEFTGGCSRSK